MTDGPRVALVGSGRWGVNILRDLLALGCDVPVVNRTDASNRAAAELGATSTHTSVDGLEDVDGFVIASPTITHGAIVRSVADRGVPIYVEKPVTSSSAEARELEALAPGRVFQMDKWRYHRGVECLRDLARSGDLGEVHGVSSVRVQWGNAHHGDVDAVWILAPHDLSIAYEILGTLPSPNGAVAASGPHPDDTELWATLGHRPFVTIFVSSRGPEFERRVTVHGSERIAVLAGGYDEVVSVYTPGTPADPEEHRFPQEMPLLAELQAFVDHLEGGPPPKSSCTEAIGIIEAIETMRSLAGLDAPAPAG